MLLQILVHTPAWVFALLALLVCLGALQLRDRHLSLHRALILPAVMLLLSATAVLTTFGETRMAIPAWLAGVLLTAGLMQIGRPPAKARWNSAEGILTVPGSWGPMALMMGIFATRYGVAATLAMAPALAGQTLFAVGFATLYGVLSGLFAGRAAQLYRLTRLPGTAASAAQALRTSTALPA